MKVCVIFNICGISGKENSGSYIESIQSILRQDFDDFRVVVSGCYVPPSTQEALRDAFGKAISYNFIASICPVNISFNHTVRKCVAQFGPARAYLYIDSGITFDNQTDIISRLYQLHCSGPYGMTAGRVDTDAGTWLWFRKGKNERDESGQEELFSSGHLEIPIGKTTNLHLQLFDHAIYEGFEGYIIPDIFASHCTESTFSFINASIHKKFIIHKDIIVRHHTSMDGASSGFRPEFAGVPGWQHLLPPAGNIFDIINNPQARECGFGYEECQQILMHDPSKFNAEGFAVFPKELRQFIYKNIYLGQRFDYNQLVYDFSA